MKKTDRLIQKLTSPAREFSPVPFWFLNDALTDEEIVRQLTDFNEKGVHGVVLHPRMGVPESIPYLSDGFMHYIKVAVETAQRLDMSIVLYDEAMYPSGSAHGLVVKADPRFASQAIMLYDELPTGGKLIARTPSGRYLVQIESGGHMRGIHFGEDDGEANAPRTADLLNAAAVAKFIELTHERYYALLKEHFGKTIVGFFTDEPSVLGRGPVWGCRPWTHGFEDTIVANGGRLEALEDMFMGKTNDTVALYERLIFERENETYYGALSSWCESHGIALMGHPHRGDDIEMEQYFHIPGQDVVLRWIAPENNAISTYESAQGKCTADAARWLGRRRNSNECYGACCRDDIPWSFSGGDLKWYTDWLGVRGVNLFIPHAFYYSVEGKRKDERPPDVGPNNIWWRYFDTVSTYIKRLSCLMTDSVNRARVAVLCENRHMPVDEVAPLYQRQLEFNYVPYRALADAVVENGRLTLGSNTYDCVMCDERGVLPDVCHISCVDELAWRDVETDVPCPDLRVSRILKDGVNAVLLVNEGETTVDTCASIEGQGGLVAMDLWRGETYPIRAEQRGERLVFHLTLKRRESLLLLIDEEGEPSDTDEPKREYITPAFDLVADDTVAFIKTYRATLTTAPCERLYLRVRTEEGDMVECFVNGHFAGFSLWNDHEFLLSPYLGDGENTVELRVTGSAVNRFTEHRLAYGLR